MRDVSVVQILQCEKELLYNSLGLLFSKLPISLSLQMRVQTLTVGVLHNEVNIFGSVNAFMQLDDVWMI